MLHIGLLGASDDVRSAVTARLRDLGADIAVTGTRLPWHADDPRILVRDLGRRPAGSRRHCFHALLGIDAEDVDVRLDAGDLDAVDRVWAERLEPFEANLRAGRRAPRRQWPVLVGPDPTWPTQAGRLIGRLRDAVGSSVIRIDHIGSTSVPGLVAKELVDLQVVVADLVVAGQVARAARRAGFVHVSGRWFGSDRHGVDHPEEVVVDADPGRPVNVNIRAASAPVWRDTLLFRDWLRANDDERDAYATAKHGLADRDVDTCGVDKLPWIRVALERAERWAAGTGWAALR